MTLLASLLFWSALGPYGDAAPRLALAPAVSGSVASLDAALPMPVVPAVARRQHDDPGRFHRPGSVPNLRNHPGCLAPARAVDLAPGRATLRRPSDGARILRC